MMSNATKRAILRWIHLIFAIPIIGYLYSPFAELPNYAPIVRYVAFPVVLLSGLWMYAGVIFAFIGVAVWLSAYQLFGMGPAILSLIALLIARKIWLVVRARRLKDRPNKALLGRNQDVGAIRNTR
jgi:predicted tellurium resistance membrane protein TerC